jgi:hypothetical protein
MAAVDKSGFVPFETYMKGHLEHERQIAMNTARITELFEKIGDLGALAKDTNDKVTKHIVDEDKIWRDYTDKQKDMDRKLDELKVKLDAPSPEKSIKYSTIRKFVTHVLTPLASLVLILYYLNLIFHFVR